MNSKLKLVSTLNMSNDEWLAYRFNGIGGSEISAILGLNPYTPSHKIFYQKLQEIGFDEENESMFWGTENESNVADKWQYYDLTSADKLSYIKNKRNDRIIRKCRRVNAYVINPDYPYLFASLDRLINKNNSEKEGILECKTISAFAAKVWEAGIPPMYYAQLQHYLLVTELEYGELATLKDGKYFEVLPFERNETFIAHIKEAAADFWDRVTRARILKQEGKPYEHLEPETDNIEAYKAFLSERYKAEPKKINPQMHFFSLGERHIEINAMIKALESEQQQLDNEIKAYMKECDEMDFGASGKITWKQNKDSLTFNKDLFKESHPALYDKYIYSKPGSRVFKVSLKAKKAQSEKEAA